MNKRIWAQVLMLCLVLSVLPASAQATTDAEPYPYIEGITNSGQISAKKTLTVIATSSDLYINDISLKAINVDNGKESIPSTSGSLQVLQDGDGCYEYKQKFVLDGDLKITGGKWTFEVTSTYKLTNESYETRSSLRTLPNDYEREHWYSHYTIVDGIPDTPEESPDVNLEITGLMKPSGSGGHSIVTGTDITKVYDGTKAVPPSLFTSWEARFKDENGDIVELKNGTDYRIAYGEFDKKDAGNQTVTFFIELIGNDRTAGYSVSDKGVFRVSGGTIEKKEIYIDRVSASNKVYDGKTDAYVTPTFTGLVLGESLTKNDYTITASFADANVGVNKAIRYSITLNNNGVAKNYTLITDVDAAMPEAKANITAKNTGSQFVTDDSAGISGTTNMNGTTNDGASTSIINVSTSDIQNAVTQAEQNGSKNITIIVDDSYNASADSIQVHFPVSAINSLIRHNNSSLTVITPMASISIPNGSLCQIDQSASNFTVSVESLNSNTVHVALTQDSKDLGILLSGMRVEINSNYIHNASSVVAILTSHDKAETVCPMSIIKDNKNLIVLLDSSSATIRYQDNSMSFADVNSSYWAYDAINFVSSHGLFRGINNNTFDGTAAMNRAMLVTVLHRLEGSPYTGVHSFSDVPIDCYYAQAAAWAYSIGIIQGYGDGDFNGKHTVTRQEAALILYRYVQTINGYKGKMVGYYGLSGADQVSDWADESMQWAVGSGIIQGSSGNLRPKDGATRSETAQMIVNFINLITQ